MGYKYRFCCHQNDNKGTLWTKEHLDEMGQFLEKDKL